MYDIFGRGFYEWWAGLNYASRILVAPVILGIAGVVAWLFPSSWIIWGPAFVAGGVLLLAG